MVMKKTMVEHLLSGLPIDRTVKELFTIVGKQFQTSNNVEVSSLINELYGMRYTKSMGLGFTYSS